MSQKKQVVMLFTVVLVVCALVLSAFQPAGPAVPNVSPTATQSSHDDTTPSAQETVTPSSHDNDPTATPAAID